MEEEKEKGKRRKKEKNEGEDKEEEEMTFYLRQIHGHPVLGWHHGTTHSHLHRNRTTRHERWCIGFQMRRHVVVVAVVVLMVGVVM